MTYDPTGNQPNDPYQYPDSQQPTSGGYYPQQPGYDAYSQPGYQQPGYEQPGYQQPGYQQPGYAAPGYQAPQQGYPGQQLPQGMAIAAMVLGIASVPLLFCCYIGIITGILAIILGLIAMNQAKQGQAQGHGMALAGVITGGVVVVLFIGLIVLYLAAGVTSGYTYY